jgi:glycosyltransferase involved in cell wall biosynthesis
VTGAIVVQEHQEPPIVPGTLDFRVSAIIPTYNRRDRVMRAVRSALAQRLAPHEILVVDDGSNDGTAAAVGRLAESQPAIRYLQQRNAGPAAARNRGMEVATGNWLAFLDSDDEWTREKLHNAASLVAAMPDTEFVHSACSHRTRDGSLIHGPRHAAEDLANKHFLMRGFTLKTTTVMIKRSLAQSVGGFREDLRTCEDYEFFWRAVAQARGVGYVPARDAVIHVSDDGLSIRHTRSFLMQDNVAALGSAARWMERQPSLANLARVMRARQYWEYRTLLQHQLRRGALLPAVQLLARPPDPVRAEQRARAMLSACAGLLKKEPPYEGPGAPDN